MRHRAKHRRQLQSETLEVRRCLAASFGWDGPGQGSADLSYYVGAAPAGMSQAAVESAIESALKAWSDVIDVDFTQTSQPNQRDSIDFSFRWLDGSGGTLAQAYLPDDVNPARIAGDVQFDSSERWEIGNALGRTAFDLARVAVHEVGHALGVDHLNISGAVMAPFVSPSETFTGLRTADVDAALALYGEATTSPTPPDTPAETELTNGSTTDDTATPSDPANDNNTPNTNRDWRSWIRFWWWRNRSARFSSRLEASPAQHNSVMPADVNQDGSVSSRDALAIVNQLAGSNGAEGESTMLADANGDGSVSVGDALVVINEVARISAGAAANTAAEDESGDFDGEELEFDDSEIGETESNDGNSPNDETIDDTTAEDDSVPVDDPSTVDDTTPSADTPPVDDPDIIDDDPATSEDGDPTSDEDQAHCAGFGLSIGRATERLFTLLDTNEDGVLTSDEISASLMEALAPIDINADGMITREEVMASRPDHVSRRFGFLDDNGDGVITEDEVNADIWDRISPADADENGEVTVDELTTFRESLPPKRFTRLDDDANGLITQDEVNEMFWTTLVGFDTDGDSAISPEEFSEIGSFGQRGNHRGFRLGAFRFAGRLI